MSKDSKPPRKMTNYGTIPTSLAPGSSSINHDYISRTKERIVAGLGPLRSWELMFDYHKFNFPSSFSESIHRLKTSIPYFLMNYVLIVLGILFMSQNLDHPISLVLFLMMMAALVILYPKRDAPLVIFNRTSSYRVVMIVLTMLTGGLLLFDGVTQPSFNILITMLVGTRVLFYVLTILNVGLLLLTGVTLNILISLLVGVVVAALHAALRKTEDLYVDEESAGLLHSGVIDSSCIEDKPQEPSCTNESSLSIDHRNSNARNPNSENPASPLMELKTSPLAIQTQQHAPFQLINKDTAIRTV